MSNEIGKTNKVDLQILGQVFIVVVASLGIITAVIMGVVASFSSTDSDKGNQSHTTQQNW